MKKLIITLILLSIVLSSCTKYSTVEGWYKVDSIEEESPGGTVHINELDNIFYVGQGLTIRHKIIVPCYTCRLMLEKTKDYKDGVEYYMLFGKMVIPYQIFSQFNSINVGNNTAYFDNSITIYGGKYSVEKAKGGLILTRENYYGRKHRIILSE